MRRTVVPFFISHLGCPHRCVFCDQEKIAGARGVVPTTHEIEAKVASYRETSAGRGVEVAFYGGTFTALPEEDQRHLLGSLQPLLQSGAVQSVRVSTRPDAVDATTASFLKKMGVGTVELGVQSMDEEVLSLSGRGHGSEDVERAVAALQDAGVETGIQLMPGLPGDTRERSLASLHRVLALNPSFLRIYPTLVISGTALADLYGAGRYAPLSLDDAVSVSKIMLLAARRASVPVIRMGLQPTEELASPGVLVAGPCHPAFGQLVESEICYDLMRSLVQPLPAGARVTFLAPRGGISNVVGHKKRNVTRLQEKFGVRVVAVREDAAIRKTEIAMEWEGGMSKMDAADLLL